MTEQAISATAEWALRGKRADDRGYRLLDWSDHILGKRNFEEALERYSPGTLEHLPQAMLSFLPAEQPGLHYVAIAIHDWPADEKYDAYGREIEFTSFFCLPYSQLAPAAISYRAMYEAFRPTQLPTPDRAPVQAELTVTPPRAPAADDLALHVAPLLLTGRPVCVLDADQTSLDDRLGFIDSVMSLLPYGMRSRMSAATWASSTYREHRFRLFFSNAPRTAQEQDHVVFWERPDLVQIPDDCGYARDYLAWLEHMARQPMLQLAGQTDETGFSRKDVLQILDRNGVASREEADSPADEPDRARMPPVLLARRGRTRDAAEMAESCSRRIGSADTEGLRSDIEDLRTYLLRRQPVPAAERERCRDVVATCGLLAPRSDVPGALAASLYDVLLRAAFGMPLTYEAYCQLEDCLGERSGGPAHRALLGAIVDGGPHDLRVQAIVFAALGDSSLNRWLHSGEPDVVRLLDLLADDWPRVDHARVVCAVTMRFLSEMRGYHVKQSLEDALHRNGYLAQALQRRHPDEARYQTDTLDGLLRAAYPEGLSRSAISRVLAGSGGPPTVALLAAVLGRLASADEARFASEEYLRGALSAAIPDTGTRALLPQLLEEGAGAAAETPLTESRPAPDVSRWLEAWGRPARRQAPDLLPLADADGPEEETLSPGLRDFPDAGRPRRSRIWARTQKYDRYRPWDAP